MMKAMIKMELIRAFRNKLMLFSLVVGNVIVMAYYFFSASKNIKWFYFEMNHMDKIIYPLSSYNCWIGLSINEYALLYFFIMPILAAIPYGASFFLDRKDGFINNILIRTERKKYFCAKLITFFISGGVVATVPLILSYILAIVSIPTYRPFIESFHYAVRDFSFLNQLFYSDFTFVYIIIYIIFDFIVFGLINCLCMVFTYWEDNRFAIVLTPFILCYGLHMFGEYFLGISQTPLTFVRLFFMQTDKLFYVFLELFILFCLAVFSLRGRKRDVI